jgi:hypothetical protein
MSSLFQYAHRSKKLSNGDKLIDEKYIDVNGFFTNMLLTKLFVNPNQFLQLLKDNIICSFILLTS